MIRPSARRLTESSKLALAGVGVITAIVLVSYYSSIRVGFLGDDWWFLGKAATLSLPQYLAFYFDPRGQIFWYRPLYGLLLLLEYTFFGSSPDGYHAIQILLHLANCLLLLAVVWRFSGRWRLGLIAAAVYASLAVSSQAVFWIAVQDPLALLFYLAAVWFWITYLDTGKRTRYLLAFAMFILSVLSKESSVVLPVTLFLIDRWLIRDAVSRAQLVRRYAAWGVALLLYLALEVEVQANAYFPNRWGYGIGWHIVENTLHYLALVAFPWGADGPVIYAGLAAVVLIALVVGIRRRSRVLPFLGIQAVLVILPAAAFPTSFFWLRYLYMAVVVTSILLALALEAVWQSSGRYRWGGVLLSAALAGLVLTNSGMTAAAGADQAEQGRQMRVPIRDIFQQHPTFPPDTYLYMVEPPYPMILRNLSGMFLLRYGSNVTVWSNDAEWGGVDTNQFAQLRDHSRAYVYYFDESRRRHEVVVDPVASTTSIPEMPVRYTVPISLTGYEVTSATLPRGGEFVLLLYWQASAPIDKDYTVFVHLVNEQGETVLGEDAAPRGGRAPTTLWHPGELVIDAHLLSIPADTPPGRYRLEIGLYDLPTMERLQIVDPWGRLTPEGLSIQPLSVE